MTHLGRQAAVDAEDAVVDERGDRQVVEHVDAVAPRVDVAVLAQALRRRRGRVFVSKATTKPPRRSGSDAPRGETSDIEDDAAHAHMAHIITVTASWRFIRMERKEAIL